MRGVDPRVEKKMVQLTEGVVVEDDVLGVIKRIREYDPNLIVQYCDPALAEALDAPWRILEDCPDGVRRLVMEVWELDMRVMERLAAVDTHHLDLQAHLDMINEQARTQQKRRFKEEIAAVSELVHGVLNSSKDTYTGINPLTGFKHKFRSIKNSDD